jgi:hypothetical protein
MEQCGRSRVNQIGGTYVCGWGENDEISREISIRILGRERLVDQMSTGSGQILTPRSNYRRRTEILQAYDRNGDWKPPRSQIIPTMPEAQSCPASSPFHYVTVCCRGSYYVCYTAYIGNYTTEARAGSTALEQTPLQGNVAADFQIMSLVAQTRRGT